MFGSEVIAYQPPSINSQSQLSLSQESSSNFQSGNNIHDTSNVDIMHWNQDQIIWSKIEKFSINIM